MTTPTVVEDMEHLELSYTDDGKSGKATSETTLAISYEITYIPTP